MTSRVGFIIVLWWLLLRINLTHSAIDIKDLLPLKCRIAGVVQVERKFNFTMSEAVCDALGLQLASRTNVQKAWRFGFETCSYGWVTEKYGVISRIHNNERCGRNQTGVLTWTVPLAHNFSATCFNTSDLRINSCKPELMVTISPSTGAPTTRAPLLTTTRPRMPEPKARATAWPILPTTLRETTSPSLLTTPTMTPKTTAKGVPPATTPRVTTPPPTTPPPTQEPTNPPTQEPANPPTQEPTNPPHNQATRQSEKIVFGKLPTALLILALVFFLAAIVLAICYIKKYKTNVFFRKIKEEKESVETKVFKETAIADNTKEEETTSNGKEEKAQNFEANARSSLEAEV